MARKPVTKCCTHLYETPIGVRLTECKYGCGCWVCSWDSEGPPGVDPFGKCPNNNPIKIREAEISSLKARLADAERGLTDVSRLHIRQVQKKKCEIQNLKEAIEKRERLKK